jgi:hypothetical protein
MIVSQEPDSFVLRLTWDTEILKLAGGKEQRFAHERLPSIEVEASFVLERAELAEVRTRLFRDYLLEHEIVLWIFETTVAGSTGADNIVIDELSAAPLAEVGRRLLIRVPGLADHEAEVTAVGAVGSDALLTLDPPPPAAYRATGVQVLPLIGIHLQDGQATGRWRLNEAGRFNLSAVSTSFFESLGAGGAAVPEYDSFYLLDIPPSIDDREMLTEQHQAAVQGLEALGPTSPVSHYEYGDIARQAKFSWNTEADRQFWFTFFAAVEGRRMPFLFPTWRPDLVTAEDPVDTATELVVTDAPDYREWWAARSHKRLAIMWSDGTFQPVTVSAITDNLDGTLTLDLTDPIEIPAGAEFEYLSFLEIVRLAEDKIELSGEHGQYRFNLPLVTVQDEP